MDVNRDGAQSAGSGPLLAAASLVAGTATWLIKLPIRPAHRRDSMCFYRGEGSDAIVRRKCLRWFYV